MPAISTTPAAGAISLGNLGSKSLVDWFDNCLALNHRVAYVYAGYLCKIVDLDEPTRALLPADPGADAKAPLKKLVPKKRIFSLETSLEFL